jgi:hypothetical protein
MIARMRWVSGWTGCGKAEVITGPPEQKGKQVFFHPGDCINWDPEKTRSGTIFAFDATFKSAGMKLPRALAWKIIRPPKTKKNSAG